MTFHIREGRVFEKKNKDCVLRRAKHREFAKACKFNEQILAMIFWIQNEDKLVQSHEPNCVSTHTQTHTQCPEFITEVSYRHSTLTQRASSTDKCSKSSSKISVLSTIATKDDIET